MDDENEIIVEREGFVITLTINRPQRRNALNTGALVELGDKLNELENDPEARVIVLRGAGEAAFCSGMDLSPGAQSGVPDRLKQTPLQYAKDGLSYCPKPVIAMIYGYALGAGCDLAVACDFRIAAEGAKLGINPVKLGRLYHHEAIQQFLNLIGIAATKELFLTGRFITASKAKDIGLVDRVAPVSELPGVTYDLAQEIAENAPLAVQGTKTNINRLLKYQKPSPEDEAEMLALMININESEDLKEAIKAFSEKRKPVFKGK
ncbi:enoyl-CoA hydratase/isomerase family protein [Chloroflexota bacterium]